MSLKLNPCPHCGSTRIGKIHILSRKLPWWWWIECDECHYRGKTKLGLWRAAKAWNKEKRNDNQT